MKLRRTAALLCGIMAFGSSVSFAAVAGDQIAIGRVTPGMSTADLISIYGDPSEKHGDEWYYPNFHVEMDRKDAPTKVEEVSSMDASMATPSGIQIGRDFMDLNFAYGKADHVIKRGDVEEYEYFSTDYTKKLKFTVVNSVITKIKCELVD